MPETACEEFNRFLDSGVSVGTVDDPALAFFDSRRRVTVVGKTAASPLLDLGQRMDAVFEQWLREQVDAG